MELKKRLLFLFFYLLSLVCFFWADPKPLIMVKTGDFGKEFSEKKMWGRSLYGFDPEPLKNIEEFKEKQLKDGKIKFFSGSENGIFFDDLYKKIHSVIDNDFNENDKEWQKRLPDERFFKSYVFFKPDEELITKIGLALSPENHTIFLKLNNPEDNRYIKFQYKPYSFDDFHLGSYSNSPNPPVGFLFPLRYHAKWTLLFGFLIFLFFPSSKKEENAVYYPKWQIYPLDFVSLLFLLPFITLPFLISGSFQTAFTHGIFLWLFFIPLSIGGILLMKIAIFYAGFQIIPLDNGFKIITDSKKKHIVFDDIDFIQPVVFKPPGWLIVLSWIAALSGKGSSALRFTGQAMTLSSSEWQSIAINMKDGSVIYINLSDALGNKVIKDNDKLFDLLIKAGVNEKKEIMVIRSMGFESIKL